MGQVCAKHNQYYETECRWCEPPEMIGLNVLVPPVSFFGIDPPMPAVLGGYYCGYDLLPNPTPSELQTATGAVPAIRQANGLILPARPARPPDPSVRADVEKAWNEMWERTVRGGIKAFE